MSRSAERESSYRRFLFCSFFFCACFAKRKSGWRICFFFCLLTILGFCMVGELTHMRSMCVGVAETGVEHCSLAKNHKVTFLLLALLNDQKRGKSQQGGLTPSSFQTSVRRARVSRMSRAWQARAARDKNESRQFCRSPWLQLYHACEHSARKSRADSCTHCLHAR